MSRIAKWRRGADDPPTAREWLYRNDLSLADARCRALIKNLGLILAILSVGTLLTIAFPKAGSSIALAPFAVIFVILLKRAKENPPEDRGPGDTFDVRLTLRDEESKQTGSDRGVLVFSEGWILFEGERTSFAVTRGEAVARSFGTGIFLTFQFGRKAEIRLSTEDRYRIAALGAALLGWNAAEIPEGEAVLPPEDVHPVVWIERWTLSLQSIGIFLFVLLVGIVVESFTIVVLALVGISIFACAASLNARRFREELPRVLPLEREALSFKS